MKKATGGKGKQSSVIKTGTGSGSRPMGGSTRTATSEPKDKHTMDRRGSVKALS